jgi:hypothetical protein
LTFVLVDCDIHRGYDALGDLVSYLDPPTLELVLHSGSYGLSMPSYPWNHPTGWIRRDVYADDDGAVRSDFVVGTSLDMLRVRRYTARLEDDGVLVSLDSPD